jgi:hypothetical protein
MLSFHMDHLEESMIYKSLVKISCSVYLNMSAESEVGLCFEFS